MANCGVVMSDANSIFSNPAGLANLKYFQTSISAENKFMMQDLNSFLGAAIFPTKNIVFGVSAYHFGFDDFNENKIGLALAKKLSEKFEVGIQLNYFQQHIAEQPNQSAFAAEVGFITRVTKTFKIGFHAFNPIPYKTNYFQSELPSLFTLGIGWQASKNVLYLLESDENLNFQTNIKTGLEYKLIEKFVVRCGLQTFPRAYSAGFGFHFQKIYFDVSNVFHPILGNTPKISFTFFFK
jgi:hypothetical protein